MFRFLRNFSGTYRKTRRSADKVLKAVSTQARSKVFYSRGGVADTVTGRFDMMVMHSFLVMRAMRRNSELSDLNQAFLDALFSSLDSSFRELGVGDASVPRKIRKAAEALYGRLSAYDEGLDNGGLTGLQDAIVRNLYRQDAEALSRAPEVASYLIGSLGKLALLGEDEWRDGRISFAALPFEEAK